jgi:hypothetical protein
VLLIARGAAAQLEQHGIEALAAFGRPSRPGPMMPGRRPNRTAAADQGTLAHRHAG